MTALVASYDAEADTAYVYLQPRIAPTDVVTTVPVPLDGDTAGVLLELDADGRLLGLEVRRAAATLPTALLARLTG